MTAPTDVMLEGHKQALWPGQFYDLPVDVADKLIDSGKAEIPAGAFPTEPAMESKAVETFTDKAVKPQRNKRGKAKRR